MESKEEFSSSQPISGIENSAELQDVNNLSTSDHSASLMDPILYDSAPFTDSCPQQVLLKYEHDDRTIRMSDAMIYPSEKEWGFLKMKQMLMLRCLNVVANDLNNSSGESSNELLGVARVGPLVETLLLNGEREFQLVGLFSLPPTAELMDRVSQLLVTHLKVVVPHVTFTVCPCPEQAFIKMTATEGHGLTGVLVVTLYLTSNAVEEEHLAAANEENVNMAEKKGRLNSKDCIFALNLVRRARWFREQILGLDNCITVIRVMRDFCFRTPTWSKIDLWAIEIIVHRAACSAGTPLTAEKLFRRTFESISAGILTSGYGWNRDRDDQTMENMICATSDLLAEDHQIIISSARDTLRLIDSGKIYEVLGLREPFPQ